MSLIEDSPFEERRALAVAKKILREEYVWPLIKTRGYILKDRNYGYDPVKYRKNLHRLIRNRINPITGVTEGKCLKLVSELYNYYFVGEGKEQYDLHRDQVKAQWDLEHGDQMDKVIQSFEPETRVLTYGKTTVLEHQPDYVRLSQEGAVVLARSHDEIAIRKAKALDERYEAESRQSERENGFFRDFDRE
jgi:hypothetical protein